MSYDELPKELPDVQPHEEAKPKRPAKEKRMVTIRRYPGGPYVRQFPKNVKKNFKELSRAVQGSDEYAAAFFDELCAPILSLTVAPEIAATAANLIMIRLFGHDMSKSKAFKKWSEYKPSAKMVNQDG